jgi:hypothetical protein
VAPAGLGCACGSSGGSGMRRWGLDGRGGARGGGARVEGAFKLLTLHAILIVRFCRST